MEVTFEQASNNTVDVEFVVRLSPLALPTPEHSLALHPGLPCQQCSLSEIIQPPLSNILNHFSSEYSRHKVRFHKDCIHVLLYLVNNKLKTEERNHHSTKEPPLRAPFCKMAASD